MNFFRFIYIPILLMIFSCLVKQAECYFLVIDAHGEECFFERVASGTKMGLTFEVVEGGFLDLDLSIIGINKKKSSFWS